MAKQDMTEEEMALCEEHFGKVYFRGKGDGDSHSEFAKLLGVSRNRAKEMAWEFILRSKSHGAENWIRHNMMKTNHLVSQVRKHRKVVNLPAISRFAIHEEAEDYADKVEEKLKNKQWGEI